MDDKKLKEALEVYSEKEIRDIENEMLNFPEHIFTDEFECKMDKLMKENDEKCVSVGKRSFRKIFMIAAVAVMLFACVGFSPIGNALIEYCKGVFQKEEIGNIAMGLGRAAYDGENVYFLAHEGSKDVVYSYNVGTEQLESMNLQDNTPVRASMFVNDEYIYYGNTGENGGLSRISIDGTISEQVLEYGEGFQQIFLDEKNAYILESIDGGLYVQSLLDDSKEELFSSVLSYFVDEDEIYVIAREKDVPCLFVAEKNSMKFEKQNLSFTPIAIYVQEEGMYLARQGDYQIVKVRNGKEEVLPINGTYYQVIDDKVVYLDSKTFVDSCFDLVSYDIVTEESCVISQNVFDFAVLGEEYIYLQCDTAPEAEYYLYDYQSIKQISIN